MNNLRLLLSKLINKTKYRQVHRNFRISGTKYLTSEKAYRNRNIFPNFKSGYNLFLKKIEVSLANDVRLSFYKFGDGDYYFLKGIFNNNILQ